jgi:hypothetical protein
MSGAHHRRKGDRIERERELVQLIATEIEVVHEELSRPEREWHHNNPLAF